PGRSEKDNRAAETTHDTNANADPASAAKAAEKRSTAARRRRTEPTGPATTTKPAGAISGPIEQGSKVRGQIESAAGKERAAEKPAAEARRKSDAVTRKRSRAGEPSVALARKRRKQKRRSTIREAGTTG